MEEALMLGEMEDLGLRVEIGSIEAELKKLWEADEASTNASLMNLAVYSECPGSLERNSDVIQALTQEHACRAILIGRDSGVEAGEIKAWITAHCHLAHGRKSVCCEQVSFLLGGEAAGRLRNTVFAHLASDLPLIFWWQGELSDLFEPSLYRTIDRFLFDSSEWSDPLTQFERIRTAAKEQARMVMQDLAWTRSYHFRMAVAGLFDDLVAQRALPEMDSVTLVAHPEVRTTALLFVAWLATQAGWRLGLELDLAAERAAGCEECFAFESEAGRSLTVRINWNEGGPPLSRVEMRAPGLLVEVERDDGFLWQRLNSPGHKVVLRAPSDPIAPVDLVADQLSRGGKNGLYRKVWPCFAELLALS